MRDATVLVADVGGTNTRVALARGPVLVAGSTRRFRNAEHGGLEQVINRYLDENGQGDLAGACVAIAGPVRDGLGTLTNLDWTIDAGTLSRATGAAHTAILNDLQAQGHALDHLAPATLRSLLPGSPAPPDAARLVIGIGTGFNVAAVLRAPRDTLVTAAEAGHAALPVENEADLDLARFARGPDKFAAVEDVLSGRGLERVFAWVSRASGAPQTASSSEVMVRAGSGDDAALEALRVFTRYLGIVAGNLALTFLPFGGIYLCGGMARAVAPHVAEAGFADAFRGKGRFSAMMHEFPVSLIEDDYAALTGCAAFLAARA